jgi:hypothetical protein
MVSLMDNNNAPTAETTRNNFAVPEQRLGWLREKLGKLARKAQKLGCEQPTLVVGDSFLKESVDAETGTKTYIQYFNVVVTGPAPRINGWSFVATLDHADGEVVVRTSPEFKDGLPKHFRTADPRHCDHCQKLRMRNETFVLRNDAGEFKRVGRQCLRDFFGHEAAASLAAVAELLWAACETAEAADAEGGGVGGGNYVDLNEYLLFVAAAIRQEGWLSRGAARAF